LSIEENKAVVGRWFTEFWGDTFNPGVIDELAAPNIRFEYSMHAPCRGRGEVREFATKFRASFPDLSFSGTAELLGEGDYVIGQWEGGGTHTGPAFDDIPVGSLPANTGRKMHFTGITVLKVENGLITEELGLDDGVTVLKQLGLIPQS
jgi:predicted ester cyclase